MRLTKLEHAALVLEEAGKSVVVDPGSFTTPLTDVPDVVAVVITHEHADHWTPEQLRRILDRHPDARIVGPGGVVAAAAEAELHVEAVSAGDEVVAGPFALRFFGGDHAVIHETIPVVDNLGVLVNGTLYYGGDSFFQPGVEIDTLAVPAGAPWLKIAESMDYVAALRPKRTFPTHEMVLSQAGKQLSNDRIKAATEAVGGEFFPLTPDESLDL